MDRLNRLLNRDDPDWAFDIFFLALLLFPAVLAWWNASWEYLLLYIIHIIIFGLI